MIHFVLRLARAISGHLMSLLALAVFTNCAYALSPGVTLEFGGSGSEPGKFADLRAFTVDTKGNVYTVEGGAETKDFKSKYPGNLRIQKFDGNGTPLAQFPLSPANGLPESIDPKRLAVDDKGYIYVTDNKAGQVLVFEADGRLHKAISVPHVVSIKRLPNGLIAVLPSDRAIIAGKWVQTPASDLVTLSPEEQISSVHLDTSIEDAQDFDVDHTGNIYVVGGKNILYKFNASGKLVQQQGSGAKERNTDGSACMYSVSVDSKGNVYTMDYGMILKFDGDLKTVTLHQGKYSWFDDWNTAGAYFPIFIDASDHVWGASIALVTHQLFDRFHFRPVVMRMADNFFTPGELGVAQSNTIGLGLTGTLDNALPNSVAYDLKPIPVELSIIAAHRNTRQVTADYKVFDVTGTIIAKGLLDISLEDDIEARRSFTFTPPKYGWYMVAVQLSVSGVSLSTMSQYIAVTKLYLGLTALNAKNKAGGWDDAARQTFSGLPLMRLNPTKGLDNFEKSLNDAEKYGALIFGQFTDVKDCTPENVRTVVTRFRGRVPVWEVMNEPNFKMTGDKYAELLAHIAPIIKECDPAAKVMGPDACGIQMPWYEAFYAAGGGKLVDILSIHDYEGHESIDPEHWSWKIGALRTLMAKNGDGNKAIWQTERAITGVRGGVFFGASQAIRILMHRDLLQTLDIPGDHNMLYYMNQGGYSSVPSYIWSASGPHPAVLGLRIREAMIKGRKYSGTLDFGAQGNEIYQGLKFDSADGTVLIVRNLGALASRIRFLVAGGNTVNLVDAFGNETSELVSGGSCELPVSQWPLYVRLQPGQTAVPVKMDLGSNVAKLAKFSYSSTTKSDMAVLNNGILETVHFGNPHGDTQKPPIFIGDLPTLPQYLTVEFPTPQLVNSIIVDGLHADNAFCALLDYDIEAKVGGNWMTVQKVRTPLAESLSVQSPQCTVTSWLEDSNRFYNHFGPVTASALRLVIRRTTYGFAQDTRSNEAVKSSWGKPLLPQLMLREVEIYSR